MSFIETFTIAPDNIDDIDVQLWQTNLFTSIRFPPLLNSYITNLIKMFLNCDGINEKYTKIISILLYSKIIIPFLEKLHEIFINTTNILATDTTLSADQNALLTIITPQHTTDAKELSISIYNMLLAQDAVGLPPDSDNYKNTIRAGFKLIQIRIISVLSHLRHIKNTKDITDLENMLNELINSIGLLRQRSEDDRKLHQEKGEEIRRLTILISKLRKQLDDLQLQHASEKDSSAASASADAKELQRQINELRAKITALEGERDDLLAAQGKLQAEIAQLKIRLDLHETNVRALRELARAQNRYSTDLEGIAIDPVDDVGEAEYKDIVDKIRNMLGRINTIDRTKNPLGSLLLQGRKEHQGVMNQLQTQADEIYALQAEIGALMTGIGMPTGIPPAPPPAD